MYKKNNADPEFKYENVLKKNSKPFILVNSEGCKERNRRKHKDNRFHLVLNTSEELGDQSLLKTTTNQTAAALRSG